MLDHITAGKALQVYHDLELDKLDCSVAILQNVKSSKMGKKDILKIDKEYDVNLDVLGYIDPDITVSIIKDGQTVEKKKLALPKKLINVKKCKNPRCITSTEPGIVHIFKLADEKIVFIDAFIVRQTSKMLYKIMECVIIIKIMG